LPFASVLFGSFGFYLFAASALANSWPWLSKRFGGESSDLAQSVRGMALLSCVPPIVGLIGMGLGDRTIFPIVRQRLGMSLKLLPRGILCGLLASAIVMPLMFFAEDTLERAYRTSGYSHDSEVPLLHMMGEAPNLFFRAALVLGACVIAPVWEEAFFRGHLQTLMKRIISRVTGSPSSEHRSPAVAWTAIVITSALFAALHPGWTIPAIFLLALCLGYAYERTGNLWVAIGIHATFNSVSTLMFLTHGGAN